MKPRVVLLAAALSLSYPVIHGAGPATADRDPVLRALQAEMARSAARLVLPGADRPYFLAYAVEDVQSLAVEASFGALVRVSNQHRRSLRTDVRLGSYERDSSEFIGSRSPGGLGSFPRMLVTEDDEAAIRHDLWLATDEAYKSAVEEFARKKAVLASRVESEPVPDFSREEPVVSLSPRRALAGADATWAERARRLSAIFRDFPEIQSSSVEFVAALTHRYLVNSEGTAIRLPNAYAYILVRASTQAADGSPLHHFVSFSERSPAQLPSEESMAAGVAKMARELTALRAAPALDRYVGPVLFLGQSAPVLFAELLAPQLSGRRPPLTPQAPAGGIPQGTELSERLGRTVLPTFLSVVDDPTQERSSDEALFGSYSIDDEGVTARPVSLIENGVLKTLLMTRRPRKEILRSNGHARGGAFAAPQPQIGNLFVKTSEGKSVEELKQELIRACKTQGLSFGILIRKQDAMSGERDFSGAGLSGARARGGLAPPVLAYRVFPDGKEELVRGLGFGTVSVKSLKEIIVAGRDESVYSRTWGGPPTSVVAPSVLFGELELRRDAVVSPRPALLSNPFFDTPRPR